MVELSLKSEVNGVHVTVRTSDQRLITDLATDARATAEFAEMLSERIHEAIDKHLKNRITK